MKSAQPSIQSIGVNLAFVTDPEVLASLKNESLLPSTAALHWCMSACDTRRIFSESGLWEFLFRLPIVLHSMSLLENWFGYDRLFNYRIGEQHYTFSVEDIFKHYGIEIADTVIDFTPREHFFKETVRSKGLASTKLIGLLGNLEVIPVKKINDFQSEEITYMLEVDSEVVNVNDKITADAKFFAQDVMRLAPKELFGNQERFKIKIEEIEARKKAIAAIPEFDINRIPSETRKSCMKLMFDPVWVDSCHDTDEDYLDKESKYIYLAWLFANELMVRDSDGWTTPAEGVNLALEDYAIEDGKWNLDLTYDDFNIEEVEPLLKGTLFS